MKKLVLVWCVVLLFAALAVCQPGSGQVLTNNAIVEMVRAGLPVDVIIAKVQTSASNFDLSTDGLVALTGQGVDGRILRAMMLTERSGQPANYAAPAGVAGVVDENSPNAPHDAGIYIYVHTTQGPRMLLVEPSVYVRGKMTGAFTTAITEGIAKTKWKAVLRGERAGTRVTDPNVVFYFYFENTRSGLSHADFGATNPNEFTLLHLDVKKSSREVVMMSANAYTAASGLDEKKAVPYNVERVRPGVYRVIPAEPLTPGEYGFISGAGNPYGAGGPGGIYVGARSKIFDFGVD
jgi:hypothetical protein